MLKEDKDKRRGGSVLYIKFVKTHDRKIFRDVCPDCGRKSFFLAFFEDWYGWSTTCLCCGREWQNGEWMPLPFSRFARKNNIESAKARWRRGLDERPKLV